MSTDVWLASVTVGNDAIAPCSNVVPIAIKRATLGASARAAASYSTLGLQPSHKNPITRSGGAASASIKSWSTEPSVRSRAPPMSASTVGATSTSLHARSNRPWARTPDPEMMNGARDCTTSSDPCSPI